jgi:predicted small lipoprotein YifL
VIDPAASRPARRCAARGSLMLISALAALLCAGATLSACGQKGQLYLPSQKKSKVPPTQQPQGTPPAGTQPPDAQPPDAQPQSSTAPVAS